MDINRFTEKLQEAIRSAQSKAIRYGNQQIDVEHLLAALLEQEGGLASSILAKAGIGVEPLTADSATEVVGAFRGQPDNRVQSVRCSGNPTSDLETRFASSRHGDCLTNRRIELSNRWEDLGF